MTYAVAASMIQEVSRKLLFIDASLFLIPAGFKMTPAVNNG